MAAVAHHWRGLGHSVVRGDLLIVPRSGRVNKYELLGGFMAGGYCVDCKIFGGDSTLESVAASAEYLLVYSRTSGRVMCYDRKLMECIGFYEKKLKVGQIITGIIASNTVSELFFMTLSDENAVQPFYFSSSLDNTLNNKLNKKELAQLGMNYVRGKIKVGPPISLELQGVNVAITNGAVIDVIDNLSKNVLIVKAATGTITLWDYSNVIEFLVRDSAPESLDSDDFGEANLLIPKKIKDNYVSVRKLSQLYLKPAAVILPPSPNSAATSFCAHVNGNILGVVWNAVSTVIYDIESCISDIKHQRVALLQPMKVQPRSTDQIISIDFHPFQPMLYQLVGRNSTGNSHDYQVDVLSLLSPALEAASSHRLTNDTLTLHSTKIRIKLHAIPRSPFIAVAYGSIVAVYKLDISSIQYTPVNSQYHIPPDSYIVPKEYKEYNSVLRTNLAVISSASSVCETENMSNALRNTLALTSFDKSRAIVSTELSTPTNSSDDVAAICASIPPADLLVISSGHLIAYDEVAVVERLIVARGSYQTAHQEKLVSTKCVHIIKIIDDNWNNTGRLPSTLHGITSGVLTSYVDFSYVNNVLAVIDQSSQRVKLFEYQGHQLVLSVVYELPVRIRSLLLIPGNLLMYSTQGDKGTAASLHLSSYDAATVHHSHSKIMLVPDEAIKQIILQPTTSQISLISTSRYVGVLTNYRAVIFDISSGSTITLVSEVGFNGVTSRLRDKFNVLARNEVITSITWQLASLVATSDSGNIYCITPSIGETKNNIVVDMAMGCSMGIIHEKNSVIHRLCSVPLSNQLHPAPRIVGILPDRMLLTSQYMNNTRDIGIKLSVQPFLPVQALISSVLPMVDRNPDWCHVITLLVLYYFRPYLDADRVENNSVRKISTTHSTRYLGYVLWSHGYTKLSALVAGIVTNNAYPTISSYATNIPYGVACYYNFLMNNYVDTKVPLNILDSISPETLYYSQYFNRFHLNVFNMFYSHEMLVRCVELTLAYHLDEAVSLIMDRVSPESKKKLLLMLETRNRYVYDLYVLAEHDVLIADALRRQWTHSVMDSMNHFNIGKLYNKRSVSQSATTLPFLVTPHYGWFVRDEALLQRDITEAISYLKTVNVSSIDYHKLVSLGPSNVFNGPFSITNNSVTDITLLEWVEDLIGSRFTLQTTMSEQSASTATGSNTGKNTANVNDSNSNNEASSSIGWTEVGTGKEWEKIVGYWRFSDIIVPTIDERATLVSKLLPPLPRLEVVAAVTDLSKYNNHMYVMMASGASDNIRIERSTNSSVDPGEDHTKVKSLCDIAFTGTASNKGDLTHLLCLPVARGSGLDIGFYHTEQERAKLTVEFNIYFDRSCNPLAPQTYLVQRIFDTGSGSARALWSLAVDADGCLAVIISDKAIKIDTPLIPNEEISVWHHVAVTMDTSSTITSTHGTNAAVTVYFDGKWLKQDYLDVPAVTEKALSCTHLFVGPNMGSGWRMTEVRIWSDVRDSIEIEREKDNYLSLASKRKRLQLRVPTSKSFFGSFDDTIFNLSSASSIGSPSVPAEAGTATDNSLDVKPVSKLKPLGLMKKKET